MEKIGIVANQENGVADNLNRDLLARLGEMDAGVHASSECWSSAGPLLRETFYWVAAAGVIWLGVFVFLR